MAGAYEVFGRAEEVWEEVAVHPKRDRHPFKNIGTDTRLEVLPAIQEQEKQKEKENQ